jgi:hypothetical protein
MAAFELRSDFKAILMLRSALVVRLSAEQRTLAADWRQWNTPNSDHHA